MPVALEIVSPEKLLLARPVDMVVIPGIEGDLGVLPGHAKLVTALRGGLIDLYEGDTIADRFFVSGGFAEVTEERVTVLADQIVKLAELDLDEAMTRLSEAEAAFVATDANDEDAYRAASDTLIAAEAKRDAARLARHGG
jgi:F-type H+-transporting ATPase subunit epsilon